MPIEIDHAVRPDFLEITCHGTFSVDKLLAAVTEAFRLAREECRAAVLLDLTDLDGQPSTMERFEVGAGVAHIQLELPSDVALAVVGKEPLIDPDRLGETVALNRYAWGKVFEDYDEAVAWIDKALPKQPDPA